MAMFVNSGRVFYAAWSPGFVVQSTLLVRAEPFLIDRRPIPLSQHSALKTDDDKAAVIRNGYLSERSIQTGLGDMAVKVRKVRDPKRDGVCNPVPNVSIPPKPSGYAQHSASRYK